MAPLVPTRPAPQPETPAAQHLGELPNGTTARVVGLVPAHAELGDGPLRRLRELGFLPGEVVTAVRRGPGGREPLAVLVGGTLLALRWVEAASILVQLDAVPDR